MIKPDIRQEQALLKKRYQDHPADARVIDAATSASEPLGDPFHVSTLAKGAVAPVRCAVHKGHGGPHDAATPGDLLCAALAACHELTVRMAASALGLELTDLHVEVRGHIDLRGSLGMPDAPVGFENFECHTRVAAKDADPARLQRLLATAERLCVVGQTIQIGARISYRTAEPELEGK